MLFLAIKNYESRSRFNKRRAKKRGVLTFWPTLYVPVSICRCTGAGTLCFWDFSGYEPYVMTYDQFIGDPNSIYVVVVSMKDPTAERRRQLHFWLDYIRCRTTLVEPIGLYCISTITKVFL